MDVLEFVDTFPTYGPAVRIGNQLAAAGTSVAAKIGVVLEESDESLFWLDVSEARHLGPKALREKLMRLAN